MKSRTLAVLALVNIVYIVVGGVVFHFLEASNEEDTRVHTDRFIAEFLRNNTCVTAEDLQTLLRIVTSAYDNGIVASYVNVTQSASSDNWDIASAISFSSTVITTIGYGYITPSTNGGRIFCIFYAIVGIPICLTMLAVLGSKLSQATENLSKRLQRKLSTNPDKKNVCNRWHGLMFVLLSGLVVFVFIPAVIVSYVEDWSYGEGLYFSIITLTTIGFGDYVLASDYDSSGRSAYRILSSIWIMLGLAWCATFIASTQDKFATIFEKSPPEATSDSGRVNEKELVVLGADCQLNGEKSLIAVSTTQPASAPDTFNCCMENNNARVEPETRIEKL